MNGKIQYAKCAAVNKSVRDKKKHIPGECE